ncbi:MAG TPA: SDR family oxidoreductase [Baekduia sp.]|jgi:NAD(P)-dependent dehydrogenase (short-subunit alcohol dehydrogenase family)
MTLPPLPAAGHMPEPTAPVVLISGAAGGIGAAAARRFAAGGWRVALTDLGGDRLDAIAGELGGAAVLAHPADVRTVAACDAAVAAAATAAGRLDCLVCAAGVWTEGPAEATLEADWDRVLDVNLKSVFFLTAAAIPHLAATQGSIVNLSSDAGLQGNTGAAVYCASKGGVTNLTRALALELAPRGVRANAVCPGGANISIDFGLTAGV